MGRSKVTRERVVMNISSLETLVEINKIANEMDCVVVVGAIAKGENVDGIVVANNEAVYMILEESMFVDVDQIDDEYFAFTKEEVLENIIKIAARKKNEE